MKHSALLLSIKPRFADAIFGGAKKFELRRIRPRVSGGDLVLVYVTSPRGVLEGAFVVEEVLAKPPDRLWARVKEHCGLDRSEFTEYFATARRGYAIRIGKTWRLRSSVDLSRLRRKRIEPPQGYRYLNHEEASGLIPRCWLTRRNGLSKVKASRVVKRVRRCSGGEI
ncbi:MAG TPA: hypothetical protein PLU30_23385 [Verrucomicrobiae bacterium]|nr:hypothetical protein [Verrucomicrobiae bacterium]